MVVVKNSNLFISWMRELCFIRVNHVKGILKTNSKLLKIPGYLGPDPRNNCTRIQQGSIFEKFLGKLQEYGIQVKTTSRDSHWQLGRTEVHGSIVKRMLERMDAEAPISTNEEFRDGLVQAFCDKNALSRAYTPEQAALGISRKLPASITSDSQQASYLLAAGETSESDQFRLSLERWSRARRAFIEADNCNSLRRAMLRRSHPLREPYEEGDWVLYRRRKGGNLRRIRGQ